MKILRECLTRAGISTREAAEIIERSEKTMEKTLNGDRVIYLHEILRLQAVLDAKGFSFSLEELTDPEMYASAAAAAGR
jgi:plasmid maintenance system antidote protein VapI